MANTNKKVKDILLTVESTNAGGKSQKFEFNEDYIEGMNSDNIKQLADLVKDVPGEKKIFAKVNGEGKIVPCEPACAHMEITIGNPATVMLDRLPEAIAQIFDVIEARQDQADKKAAKKAKKGEGLTTGEPPVTE